MPQLSKESPPMPFPLPGYDMAKINGYGVPGEIERFANTANRAIFNDVFGRLKDAYDHPKSAKAAAEWDAMTLAKEQMVAQPLWAGLSDVTSPLVRWTYGMTSMGRDTSHGMPQVPEEYLNGSRLHQVLGWGQ
jgi:hypothetical protein